MESAEQRPPERRFSAGRLIATDGNSAGAIKNVSRDFRITSTKGEKNPNNVSNTIASPQIQTASVCVRLFGKAHVIAKNNATQASEGKASANASATASRRSIDWRALLITRAHASSCATKASFAWNAAISARPAKTSSNAVR